MKRLVSEGEDDRLLSHDDIMRAMGYPTVAQMTAEQLTDFGWVKGLMKPENGSNTPKTSLYDELQRFARCPDTTPFGVASEELKAGDMVVIDQATGYIRRARADDNGYRYSIHQPISNMPKEVKPPRVTIASLQATIEDMARRYHELEKVNAQLVEERDMAQSRTKRLVDLVLGEESRRDEYSMGGIARTARIGDRYTDALARITTLHQLEGRELGATDARVRCLENERDWLRAALLGQDMNKPEGFVNIDIRTPNGSGHRVQICQKHSCPADICRDEHQDQDRRKRSGIGLDC